MKIADLRVLDENGLLRQRQTVIEELAVLKFRHASGQLDDTATIARSRQVLARVNTVIRERERAVGLHKGGLAAKIGKLDEGDSAFAAFRNRLSGTAENG